MDMQLLAERILGNTALLTSVVVATSNVAALRWPVLSIVRNSAALPVRRGWADDVLGRPLEMTGFRAESASSLVFQIARRQKKLLAAIFTCSYQSIVAVMNCSSYRLRCPFTGAFPRTKIIGCSNHRCFADEFNSTLLTDKCQASSVSAIVPVCVCPTGTLLGTILLAVRPCRRLEFFATVKASHYLSRARLSFTSIRAVFASFLSRVVLKLSAATYTDCHSMGLWLSSALPRAILARALARIVNKRLTTTNAGRFDLTSHGVAFLRERSTTRLRHSKYTQIQEKCQMHQGFCGAMP